MQIMVVMDRVRTVKSRPSWAGVPIRRPWSASTS